MEFEDDGYASYGGIAYPTINLSECDIIVVGIPYESATSGKKGTSFAPSTLRQISKDMQTMSRNGTNIDELAIKDVGNIPIFPLNAEKTRNNIETYYSHLLKESQATI
ncbi:MAG: arginase family protein, partial [Candidatus Heimdallarchaeota archaeon]|nr:arginase family protein [Candidatus Heimdallarchaeota archaeon]